MSEHGRDDDGAQTPLDEAAQARVIAALSSAGPMPDEVWQRLERALADESAARGTPQRATVRTPRRRRTPLLAGLVAAAAAIIAVAVITPQLAGDGGADIVATAVAPSASPEPMAADAVSDLPLESAAPLAAAAPAPESAAKGAPASPAQAAPVSSLRSRPDAPPAARQVMRSGTDYTADTIDDAVMTLVDTVDASHTRLMSSVSQEPDPTEGDSGFTATVDGLAGCLLAITATSDRQALVIDRATFQGADAAVVVVPTGAAASDHATPYDQIDIWVVTPDCGTAADAVVWHGTLALP